MTVTGKCIPVIFSFPLYTNHSVSGFHLSLSTHTAVTHSSLTHRLQQGLQVGKLLITHSWLLLDFTTNPLKSLESRYDQSNQIKSRGKWINCPPHYLIAKRPSCNTRQSSQQNLHNTYGTLRCSRYSSLWGSVTKAISHFFSTDFNSSYEKVGSSWLSHAHYSATYVPRGGQKCLSYKEVRSVHSVIPHPRELHKQGCETATWRGCLVTRNHPILSQAWHNALLSTQKCTIFSYLIMSLCASSYGEHNPFISL